MLTGKHPFSARNREALQKKILNEKLKFPTYLTTDVRSRPPIHPLYTPSRPPLNTEEDPQREAQVPNLPHHGCAL
eukprot:6077883-Pyramimonas_sp.AAC.2